jgi:hypothetical protein
MKRLVLALSAMVVGVATSSCAVGVRQPATEITLNGAVLNGKVLSTTGGPGSYYVEYGPTPARTERTPTRPVDFVINEPVPVSEPVEGLEPGTTYHFAVCAEDAENPGDAFCSPDQTFATRYDPATTDSVTGPTAPPGTPQSFVFDVHSGPSGENAGGTLYYLSTGTPPAAASPAKCLSVTGTKATMQVNLFNSGNIIYFFVEDNGGPGADRFAIGDISSVVDCSVPAPPPLSDSWQRVTGNLEVVDAQPTEPRSTAGFR